MLRFLLTVGLLFTMAASKAQSLGKTVLGSAGGTFSSTNTTISCTVGETLVGFIAGTNSLDQGFWAGKGILVIPLSPGENSLDLVIYPNPVFEELTVFTGGDKVKGVELFGVNGQKILTLKTTAETVEHKIDLSYVAQGTYILQVFMEGNGGKREYKIIKN